IERLDHAVGPDQRRLRERHRQQGPRHHQENEQDRTDEFAQPDGHLSLNCANARTTIWSAALVSQWRRSQSRAGRAGANFGREWTLANFTGLFGRESPLANSPRGRSAFRSTLAPNE